MLLLGGAAETLNKDIFNFIFVLKDCYIVETVDKRINVFIKKYFSVEYRVFRAFGVWVKEFYIVRL